MVNALEIPRNEPEIISLNELIMEIEQRKRFISSCGSVLHWHDFESLCLHVLRAHEFSCLQNFRFSLATKQRFEIDVIGYRSPYILCIDAKNWGQRTGKKSQLRLAALKQIKRTRLLARNPDLLTKRNLKFSFQDVKFIPMVVTSLQEDVAFIDDSPVIPIDKFNLFLQELPEHADTIKYF
ncbi:MAG: NERD domain-containing protein [Candidatus Helarchaeota archaeon]